MINREIDRLSDIYRVINREIDRFSDILRDESRNRSIKRYIARLIDQIGDQSIEIGD